MEMGFEDMFNVRWIRRDNAVKNMDVDRRRGRSPEKMSVPIAEIDEVFSPA